MALIVDLAVGTGAPCPEVSLDRESVTFKESSVACTRFEVLGRRTGKEIEF